MRQFSKYIIILFLVSCAATKPVVGPPVIPPVVVVDAKSTYEYYSICIVGVHERFVSKYIIYRSRNKNSGFLELKNFAPINTPDSSLYCYQLAKSATPYYYKVLAKMSNNTYTYPTFYLNSTAAK